MSYVVGFSEKFLRQLPRLPDALQQQVERAMATLEVEPRPPKAGLMSAEVQKYRLGVTEGLKVLYRVYDRLRYVEMEEIRYKPYYPW
jgi:mRNA-degrading endonuclease RelE of RelBE toxin-antitoxin system